MNTKKEYILVGKSGHGYTRNLTPEEIVSSVVIDTPSLTPNMDMFNSIWFSKEAFIAKFVIFLVMMCLAVYSYSQGYFP